MAGGQRLVSSPFVRSGDGLAAQDSIAVVTLLAGERITTQGS